MMLKVSASAVSPLLAAVAALILALPARAQDAEDQAAPEPSPEASVEAGQPENVGEEPAATGEAGEAPAEEGEADAGQATGENAAGEAVEGAGEETADGPVVVDIEEGSVLDDQTFEGEDDDFIPSEEIPIDQAIPFPTDI